MRSIDACVLMGPGSSEGRKAGSRSDGVKPSRGERPQPPGHEVLLARVPCSRSRAGVPVPFRGPGASNRSRCGTEPISVGTTELDGKGRRERGQQEGRGPRRPRPVRRAGWFPRVSGSRLPEMSVSRARLLDAAQFCSSWACVSAMARCISRSRATAARTVRSISKNMRVPFAVAFAVPVPEVEREDAHPNGAPSSCVLASLTIGAVDFHPPGAVTFETGGPGHCGRGARCTRWSRPWMWFRGCRPPRRAHGAPCGPPGPGGRLRRLSPRAPDSPRFDGDGFNWFPTRVGVSRPVGGTAVRRCGAVGGQLSGVLV